MGVPTFETEGHKIGDSGRRHLGGSPMLFDSLLPRRKKKEAPEERPYSTNPRDDNKNNVARPGGTGTLAPQVEGERNFFSMTGLTGLRPLS